MSTLQYYIFRRVGIFTLASFLSVLGVVIVSQALTRIDFATSSNQSILAFGQVLALLTPQLAGVVLPFAVVIGTVQVFNTMNGDSELTVMSASGVARMTIAFPVILVAFCASVFLFFSNNVLEPYSNRAVRDLLTEARTDLIATVLREGVFSEITNDLTVYIDRRLPGNRLAGIMLSDKRDPNVNLIYYAQSGAIGEVNGQDLLVMSGGQIQRKNMKDDSLSIIRFNSYAISLSSFTSADGGHSYYPYERDTLDLRSPDPNDKFFKQSPGWFYGEFHRRMTDWLYPILFAMIALTVAGQTQSHRQSRFNSFFLAIGGAVLYRWGAYITLNASRNDTEIWWVFYALPLGGIAANLLMYRYGIRVALPDAVMRRAAAVAEYANNLRARRARARTA